jgi:hypothetical protein
VGGPARTNNITSLTFVNSTLAGVPMGEALLSGAYNITWSDVGTITADGKPVEPPHKY